MVWGGISLEGKTQLHVFQERSLNAYSYITNILQNYVVPYAPFIGPDFLFMQDNAIPHTAGCVIDYLDLVRIPRMDWPARSPDMNLIESLWDELSRRVRAHLVRPETLQELKLALVEEWENIQQPVVQHLIHVQDMPQRFSSLLLL